MCACAGMHQVFKGNIWHDDNFVISAHCILSYSCVTLRTLVNFSWFATFWTHAIHSQELQCESGCEKCTPTGVDSAQSHVWPLWSHVSQLPYTFFFCPQIVLNWPACMHAMQYALILLIKPFTFCHFLMKAHLESVTAGMLLWTVTVACGATTDTREGDEVWLGLELRPSSIRCLPTVTPLLVGLWCREPAVLIVRSLFTGGYATLCWMAVQLRAKGGRCF